MVRSCGLTMALGGMSSVTLTAKWATSARTCAAMLTARANARPHDLPQRHLLWVEACSCEPAFALASGGTECPAAESGELESIHPISKVGLPTRDLLVVARCRPVRRDDRRNRARSKEASASGKGAPRLPECGSSGKDQSERRREEQRSYLRARDFTRRAAVLSGAGHHVEKGIGQLSVGQRLPAPRIHYGFFFEPESEGSLGGAPPCQPQ